MPKSKAKHTPPDNGPIAVGNPRAGWVVAATVLSWALIATAAFLPAARLWGINHLAFLPLPARAALLAVAALAFFPPLASFLYRRASTLAERAGTTQHMAHTLVVIAAIAVTSTATFYAFRSATNLLGDGQLLVQSFEAGQEGHDQVIMRSAHAIATEEAIAPGATLAYYGAIQALKPFKRSTVDSMRILNCILGGLFVFITLLAATRAHLDGETRLWLLVLTLFSSSMLLFYGYIENYTAPLFFLQLYAIAAFRALHQRGSPWLAVVPLSLAVYSHIQCILFVPSFVYLLLWWYGRNHRHLLLRRWLTVFTTALVLVVGLAPLYAPIRRFYTPLGFSNQRYALLSPDHVLDIMNEVLMLLPIVASVVVVAWAVRRAERAAGYDPVRDPLARKDARAWFSHPAEWQLAMTMLLPCIAYLVLFHPEIGMARDWDLFAMATVAIVPLVLLTLNRYRRATGASLETTARFGAPALLMVMVLGASWVAVNASTDRTVKRFEHILTYDKAHAAYAWENLAILQHDGGNLKEAIRIMQQAVAASHNPRQIVRLAVYVEEDGRAGEAITILEDVLAKRPAYSKARFRLVAFLEKTNQWDRMGAAAKDGIKYSPQDGIYHFFYAEYLLHDGQSDEAMKLFKLCQKMDLPGSVQQYIAQVLADYEKK